MVYAYDLWLPMPTKDLFDTLMMLASVNAAKDMYEKGLEEMKEFNKEYNDFLSPSDVDMAWVKNNVTDPMRNTINELYANGIDPLRSPEGRALLSRFRNSIDSSRMAQNKLTALYGQKYLEAKANLEAAGKYDPDLEERFLGYDIKNWDSSKGAWNRLSPTEAQSLKSLTTSAYDKRTPHQLTEEEVLGFGMPYDSRAKYLGFTYNDLLDIANNAAVGLKGTVYESYYRDLAKQKLLSLGILKPTEELIDLQLRRDIANQNIEYLVQPVADYKDWLALELLRMTSIRNDILRQNAETQRLRASMSGSRSGSRSGSGSGTTPKPQFDVVDFLIATATAKTLGQTSYGANFNLGGQSDTGGNPNGVGVLLKGAQSQIADEVYRDPHYIPVERRHVRPMSVFERRDWLIYHGRNSKGFDLWIPSVTGYALNPGAVNLAFEFDGVNTNFIPRIKDTTGEFSFSQPYGGIKKSIHEANLNFLQRLSNPMFPDDFAKYTKRTRDNENKDYVMMNKNIDKSRIFSADEVALSAAGIEYPKAYAKSQEKTRTIRSTFELNFKDGKTMMISEGYFVGVGQHDGAYHLYQRIRIVNKKETGSILTEDRVKDVSYNDIFSQDEYIYYDMGIDTQENPMYSLDGTIGMERKVTMENLSGDRELLKELGVGSNNIKSDISFPDIYDQDLEDLDDDLIDLPEL